MSRNDSIEQAEAVVGENMRFERLDQIYDLQRLMGPVIAYKVLLEIVINSSDDKERRQAVFLIARLKSLRRSPIVFVPLSSMSFLLRSCRPLFRRESLIQSLQLLHWLVVSP